MNKVLPPPAGATRTVLLFRNVVANTLSTASTRLVVSNTSLSTVPASGAQNGTITFEFYFGGALITTFVSPVVIGGSSYSIDIITIPALMGLPFNGYCIAVCNFQYGHGISQSIDSTVSTTAITPAIIIPDTVNRNTQGESLLM